MNFNIVASRVASFSVEAARKKKKSAPPKKVSKPKRVKSVPTVIDSPTEYSCRLDISLTANFEGDTTKAKVMKKLRSEVVAAIQSGVTLAARDLGIQAANVLVKPLNVECDVIDSSSLDDEDI